MLAVFLDEAVFDPALLGDGVEIVYAVSDTDDSRDAMPRYVEAAEFDVLARARLELSVLENLDLCKHRLHSVDNQYHVWEPDEELILEAPGILAVRLEVSDDLRLGFALRLHL